MAIEILTPEEVGELLRLSANRVVVLARRGELPYLMIDGHMRFDARDVEDWLKYQRSDAPLLPSKMGCRLGSLALRSKQFPDYPISYNKKKQVFQPQILDAKGNLLTEEGAVVTRFFYKGPSRRLQFDYVGPARVFLRLVLVFSLVIILWKVLS